MRNSCFKFSLLGAMLASCLQCCLSQQPSMRSTMFLSRVRATWNEAQEVCIMRTATLLKVTSENVIKQLRVLDASDDWHGLFQQSLEEGGVWLGLYKRNTSGHVWQDCQELGNYTAWASGDVQNKDGHQCVYLDSHAQWHTASCNQSFFYVCQRSESECWFDPLEETTASVSSSDPANMTTDASECARMCRNVYDQGRECWGFSFRSADSLCHLHFRQDATAFTDASAMGVNLVKHSNWTFFRKICLAGLIKMDNLTFSISSPEPQRQYCPDDHNTTWSWEEDVCFCECEYEPSVWDPTIDQEAYQEEFEREVKALAVDTKNTSSSIRKFISVEDRRPSAQGLGYVGVLFLCLVFGGIVLMDANVLFSHVQKLVRRCRKTESARRLRSVSPASD